ncbi:ion transporter [Carboxylicivirga mesophila]|uniref:Ion transporter n=1 Tax=Carboxylicivirga mesophila TaxID=1166478 RepID=A0ABS5K6C0_9BACT|nr:ion transporter [Carboxylicivirga mesophila]MBS2210501.1 ion transporter [Carboxylicivirga mesophila]
MQSVKNRLYQVIYETDTPAGKLFDILLIILILLSIVVVMVESDDTLPPAINKAMVVMEWCLTGLFTIEYFLRIAIIDRPRKYIFSFFGIIDLLAILPTYMGLIIGGTQMLIVVRALRLVRVFRVLKLTRYVKEASVLWSALLSSRNKISVFLFVVLIIVTIMGTVMYIVENPHNEGFKSIPQSVYWAIVTLTTVGYGDIAPVTVFGKFLAGFIMITGYAIIAVPTGIVTSQLVNESRRQPGARVCTDCLKEGHDYEAAFCKYCGHPLK